MITLVAAEELLPTGLPAMTATLASFIPEFLITLAVVVGVHRRGWRTVITTNPGGTMASVCRRERAGGSATPPCTATRPAGNAPPAPSTADAKPRRPDAWPRGKVETGTWINPADGRITFRDYVEHVWWPSRHLEASTKAGYRANLDKHYAHATSTW